MIKNSMMKYSFTKMHGLGNDYIYFDCTKASLPSPEKAAVILSDRHFGIGSDGIVLIELPSSSVEADFKMRMFNADGSEAQMCGNAVRCIAKFIHEKGLLSASVIRLETRAGIIILHLSIEDTKVTSVRVNMGNPVLQAEKIPSTFPQSPAINQKLKTTRHEFTIHAVSMGNPHCVIFVDEITDHLVLDIGPEIERHEAFPEKTNVEFVKILSPDHAKMRVWERGSGETLACGTGACAVAVAGNLLGILEPASTISLPGGDLKIEIQEDGVYKTGPATTVFEGVIEKCW
jgi:diaminopimelate epimerase